MHHAHSTQHVLAAIGGVLHKRVLPSPFAELMPGVRWGAFEQSFTPAFWAVRSWLFDLSGPAEPWRLGTASLAEEVAACLLGGYGIPAELGLAAFDRLRTMGLLAGRPAVAALEKALSEPLPVGTRARHYRFARQKSRYLAAALAALHDAPTLPSDDRALRDYLVALPGIGPKTASWITRNWRGSDAVAIIDVHVCRACQLAGVFPSTVHVGRDYDQLEQRFIAFAAAIPARTARLDHIIWETMRGLGPLARRGHPGLEARVSHP